MDVLLVRVFVRAFLCAVLPITSESILRVFPPGTYPVLYICIT